MVIHSTVELEHYKSEAPRIWLEETTEKGDPDYGDFWLNSYKPNEDGDMITDCFGPLTLSDLQCVQKCINEAVAKILKQEIAGYKE